MDEMVKKRNERLAQTVIKGLLSRNMSGYYAADKEEALKKALELIPEGSSIAMGGCRSAHEIGLIKALEAVPMPSPVTALWSTSTATPTVSPVLPRDRER